MTWVTAHICFALVLVKYHWLMTKSSLSGEVDEQKWAACLAGCWWHFSRPTGAHQAGREKASTGCCCKQATICSCGCFSTTNTFQYRTVHRNTVGVSMLELKYGSASWIYSLSAIAIWQEYCAFYQYAEQGTSKPVCFTKEKACKAAKTKHNTRL